MDDTEFGYQDPHYPRGGCLPATILFWVVALLFGAVFVWAAWWFTTYGP